MITVPYKFTRQYLQTHKELTFVYGCNLYMPSHMGQSEVCEGLMNCFSVPTKFRNCKSDNSAFFSDYQLDLIVPSILAAISLIPKHQPIILFPKIGMGCADLPNRAPKAFKFLTEELTKIKSKYTIDYKML